MSDTTKAKTSETKAKTQLAKPSKNTDNKAMLNIKPLPQGRPIANNISQGIDDLLGYLD
ncbi:MAG TPA: hypothetical protein V6C95_17335 [Coleofasciculaceae cyanobacterium]